MLILLDRDGVINEDLPTGVLTLEQFTYLDGALEAIVRLSKEGHRIAIVTNQSAVSKGTTSLEVVHQIHEKLKRDVAQKGGTIDAIYICTDHPDAPTHRRKPNPGMIEEALLAFDESPKNAALIGDALRDMQAAHSAGVRKILVETGKGAMLVHEGIPESLQPVDVFPNLLAAAQHLCDA